MDNTTTVDRRINFDSLKVKSRPYITEDVLVFISIVSDDERGAILYNNLNTVYPNANIAIRIDDATNDHASQLRSLFKEIVTNHSAKFYFTVDHDEVPILPIDSAWINDIHPYKIPVYLQPQAKDREEMFSMMRSAKYWNHFEFYKTIETVHTYLERPCHNAKASFFGVPILPGSLIKHYRFEYDQSFATKRCFKGHEYRLKANHLTSYLLSSDKRQPLNFLTHE